MRSDYGEALLFVSHDRYFIEKFATRIWALSDGVLTDFRGTFEEYRAYAQRQESLRQTARAAERKKSLIQRGCIITKSGAHILSIILLGNWQI